MTKDYFIKQILEKWGLFKTLQLLLLGGAAASITIVIGAHIIPDEPETNLIEKEIM